MTFDLRFTLDGLKNSLVQAADDAYAILHPATPTETIIERLAQAPGTPGDRSAPGLAPGVDPPQTADELPHQIVIPVRSQQIGQAGNQVVRVTVAQSYIALTGNKQLTLTLTGEGRHPNGDRYLLGPQGNGWPIVTARPDRLWTRSDLLPVGDGDVTSLRLSTTNTNDVLSLGMCHAMIERGLLLDDGVTFIPSQIMARGYITEWQPLTWPNGGLFPNSLEGSGSLQQITQPNTTGSLQFRCPLGAFWRIMWGSANLSTDGTAVTRLPLARFSGNSWFGGVAAGAGFPPSSNNTVSWYAGANPTGFYDTAWSSIALPINDHRPHLGPNAVLQLDAVNQQAADLWNGCVMNVEEWLAFTG